MKAIINFEKVKKEDNTKIIFDSDIIATSNTEAVILQSKNKNVITISYKEHYYHITLEEIVNGILEHQL